MTLLSRALPLPKGHLKEMALFFAQHLSKEIIAGDSITRYLGYWADARLTARAEASPPAAVYATVDPYRLPL